jgi:hypothetical protein
LLWCQNVGHTVSRACIRRNRLELADQFLHHYTDPVCKAGACTP